MVYIVSICVILICLLVLYSSFSSYGKLKNFTNGLEGKRAGDEVIERLLEIGGKIREGADAFMKTQYNYIYFAVFALSIFTLLFVDVISAFMVLFGMAMASAGCIFSMKAATLANVLTAFTARKSKSIRVTGMVALLGGKIPGLCIGGFGLIGIAIILLTGGIHLDGISIGGGLLRLVDCNASTQRFLSYGLGCSVIGMFNRLSGGVFTKGADISSDLVGKVTIGVDEDDYRIPSVIADFIGDNVNDVGGNGSDLCESNVAAIVSVIIAGVQAATTQAQAEAAAGFAISIAASGLLASFIAIGMQLVKMDNIIKRLLADKKALYTKQDSKNSLDFLNSVMYMSAGITILGTLIFARVFFGNNLLSDFRLGWLSPAIAPIIGIVSGVIITIVTEHYTGLKTKAVKEAARQAKYGPAMEVLMVDALGYLSVALPCVVIAISCFFAYKICGLFGISCTAVGMLSFVSAPVAIDAFGPIADNAGGLAESCIKDPEDLARTRKVTDVCDAEGNTRAAVAKGFAIGSAASAAISLNFSFLKMVEKNLPGDADLSLANPEPFIGQLLGLAFVAIFIYLLLKNSIELANIMRDESLRQLAVGAPKYKNEFGEEVIDYAQGEIFTNPNAKPDYTICIVLAVKKSVHDMILPASIALAGSLLVGFIFGPLVTGGLLQGSTSLAVFMALFMANSGGIGDNAKKLIESGTFENMKKGTDAHKVSVEIDTIGDPRKDVVAVCMDILIKIAANAAITIGPLICRYNLPVLFDQHVMPLVNQYIMPLFNQHLIPLLQ